MTAMRFFPDTDEVAARCPLYGFVTKYTPSLVRQQLDNLQVSRAAKTELCFVAFSLCTERGGLFSMSVAVRQVC